MSLFTLASLTTCKKYPQDGKRSWSTIKHRLTTHKWILKEYLINGEDDVNRYYVNKGSGIGLDTGGFYYSFKDSELEFTTKKLYKDNGGPFDGYIVGTNRISTIPGNPFLSGPSQSFAWNLSKKYISINAIGGSTVVPFFTKDTANTYWEIRKMTDKELIIKQTDNKNRIIELKFFK